jgi:pimeloyl-ACP methyl ester carboxylesterase
MHLLLLHGAAGASDQLKPIAAAMGKEFTVHTLDFSGHGSKPFPDKPYAISLFADDVLKYMDEHHLDRVAIFGYSMGGYVGMYLALHHPARISGLTTLATKFHWDPAIAHREAQLLNPDKILEKVPAFARTLGQRHHPKDWKRVLEQTAALLTDLGAAPPLRTDTWRAITVPVLLLLGDNDKMVSLEETLAVFKGIPGAQLGILPATPHPIEQVDTTVLACLLRRFYTT